MLLLNHCLSFLPLFVCFRSNVCVFFLLYRKVSAYANMFMGRVEKQLLIAVTMRQFSWLRFIDDKDMKWLHGRANLDTFLQEANSFRSTIRFRAEVSNDKRVLTPYPDWMRIEYAQIFTANLCIPTSIF